MDAHIWSVNVGTTPGNSFDAAYRILSDDERSRAARFVTADLQRKFTLTRAILRQLIGNFCGTDPAALHFDYGPHGKPFLAGLDRPVQFNVSHSGEMAAFVITDQAEVGIDVEKYRGMRELEEIAQHFFSPAEYEDLMSVAPGERQDAFFTCWVRKEAYIKSVGAGFSIPLDSFRVSLLPQDPAAILEIRNKPEEPSQWSIYAFRPAEDYFGAVAVKDRELGVQFHAAAPACEFFR